MQFRIVFYPMLDQTLAVRSDSWDSPESERNYVKTYRLKTHGSDAWDLADLLRELADVMAEEHF